MHWEVSALAQQVLMATQEADMKVPIPAGSIDEGEHCANGRIIVQPINNRQSLAHE
jgi:hypothetical protein